MKIEYLHDGSPDCPIIRIYGDEPESFKELKKLALELSNRNSDKTYVENLPNFESIDGCSILTKIGQEDIGIRSLENNKFEWILKPPAWMTVALKIEPFCFVKKDKIIDKDSNLIYCHNWLEENSDIEVLISNSNQGMW